MAHHDLKITPFFYRQVALGEKTFEIRLNDRNFKAGDTVTLHDFYRGEYTSSKPIKKKIGFVLSDYDGLDPDYVIFSLIDFEGENE